MASKQEYKEDIQFYISNDIASRVVDFAIAQYDLPKLNPREIFEVKSAYDAEAPNFGHEITKDSAMFKRFKDFLAKQYSSHVEDDAIEAISIASDFSVFSYSKNAVKTNERIQAVFGKKFDLWVENAATFIDAFVAERKEDQRLSEISELERLAKKHGRKLV